MSRKGVPARARDAGRRAGGRARSRWEGKAARTPALGVLDAIYQRRAVRSFTNQPVSRSCVNHLLDAAVRAPSAMNQQPWAFVVIQDARMLRRYSDRAKAAFLAHLNGDQRMGHFRETLSSPGFNVFYNAGTLILICAGPGTMNTAEDCCLAAQNFMLAACAMGLGTCPIGLARPMFNLPEIKAELAIPADYSPVFPIIVGYPAGETPPAPRAGPRVLSWT